MKWVFYFSLSFWVALMASSTTVAAQKLAIADFEVPPNSTLSKGLISNEMREVARRDQSHYEIVLSDSHISAIAERLRHEAQVADIQNFPELTDEASVKAELILLPQMMEFRDSFVASATAFSLISMQRQLYVKVEGEPNEKYSSVIEKLWLAVKLYPESLDGCKGYRGILRGSVRHGYGIYCWDGKKFKGTWENGSPVSGVIEYPNGSRYRGEVNANYQRDGEGTLEERYNKKIGQWQNDRLIKQENEDMEAMKKRLREEMRRKMGYYD